MDLADARARARLRARLGEPYAGRPMLLGPGILAGYTETVRWFRELGCPVLVVATATGAGPLPDPGECEVVKIVPPPAATLTDEVRHQDAVARSLPSHALEAVERFDPARHGLWWTSPFVTTDEPIAGRAVAYGRPAAWATLEDKLLADDLWDAAGVDRAPSRIVAVEDGAGLAAATAALAGPLGAVWVGDARDGLNGGADYVRWVVDEADRRAATAFFASRCDRVRVMPFLDGVPCSIHGLVLPDGTAAFRPVEIVTLRRAADRRLVYAGLGTHWDPPREARRQLRDVAGRVGTVLAERHDYRGAFGIDGVLTDRGFLPTELNPRMTAGAKHVLAVDGRLAELLQAALVTEPARVAALGVTVAALESLLPLMDADRRGRVVAFGEAVEVGEPQSYPVRWDGARFNRADGDTGNTLSVADTPSGFFARVDPCTALRVGARQAPVSRALARYLDEEYSAGFGDLECSTEAGEPLV